jgi:hypothetical protein
LLRKDLIQSWFAQNPLPLDVESIELERRIAIADAPRTPIFIHFGASKTGSTAFQHFLDTHRGALWNQGYWAPEVGIVRQEHSAYKQAGHANFARLGRTGENPDLLHHLAEGMALGEGHLKGIILSSEVFFLWPESAQLVAMLAPHPVTLIGHLRPFDVWAEAQYAESVAGGATARVHLTFQDWLAQPRTKLRLNYAGMLERWQAAGATVDVGVYDRALFPNGNVIDDLLTRVGIPLLWAHSNDRLNHFALHAGHVDLIRPINALPWQSQSRYLKAMARIHQRIASMRANKPRVPLVFLSAHKRAAFLDKLAPQREPLEAFGVVFPDPVFPDFQGFPPVARNEANAILQECLKGLEDKKTKKTAAGTRKAAAKSGTSEQPVTAMDTGVAETTTEQPVSPPEGATSTERSN